MISTASTTGNMQGLDRKFFARAATMALLFMWPLLVFQRPAYFPDSLSYYKGGQAAVAFAQAKIVPPAMRSVADSSVTTKLAARAAEARGARSIPYSVLAYVLSASRPTMIGLVVAQATLLGVILALALPLLGASSPVRDLPLYLAIAFGTPAAWYACFAMPDILAGVEILALAMLLGARAQMDRATRLCCILIGAISISAHASHVAIGLAMSALGLGGAAWGWSRQRSSAPFFGALHCLTAVLLGALIVIASGYIGFDEVSLAPKRYPLTLARSIEDGPGRWYLQRSCRVKHYEICKIYRDEVPPRSYDLLWGPRGLSHVATAQQLEQVRREEQEIVVAAAKAYPGQQAAAAVNGSLSQLISFRLGEASFGKRVAQSPDGQLELDDVGEPHPWIRRWLDRIIVALAAVSLVLVLFRFVSRRINVPVVLAILLGLAANAAVCAIFSASAARYQARVIWLLPVCGFTGFSVRRRPDAT